MPRRVLDNDDEPIYGTDTRATERQTLPTSGTARRRRRAASGSWPVGGGIRGG